MSDSRPNESLACKVALITGGSKGIGKGAAIALAGAGAQLVVSYMSDESAAEALVSEIGADKALALKSDASRMEDIESLVKETVERFGGIDILIANASISPSKVIMSQNLSPLLLLHRSLHPYLSLSVGQFSLTEDLMMNSVPRI